MLKPVHPPWKLDADGRPKRDAKGARIPNPKQNQPKKLSEYTPGERKDYEGAKQRNEDRERAFAEATLKPIEEAQRTLHGK